MKTNMLANLGVLFASVYAKKIGFSKEIDESSMHPSTQIDNSAS
jgi:hypothetical protein